VVVAGHEFVALHPQLGEDAFGIDQGLGAAEADEPDARAGCCGGRLGHALALARWEAARRRTGGMNFAPQVYRGARLDPRTGRPGPRRRPPWARAARSRFPGSARWARGWPGPKRPRAAAW